MKTSKETARLRSKANDLTPALRIGKNGLTPGVVEELRKLLDKRGLVKVKLLKSALGAKDRKELFEELASLAQALLVGITGMTAVMHREKVLPKTRKKWQGLNKQKRKGLSGKKRGKKRHGF